MNTAAKQLNRLSDFIIEEVSLVDRAANKRRFLQVKRDDTHDLDVAVIEQDQRGVFSVQKATWTVGAARDLSIVEGSWDGAAAAQRIWAWAGFDGDKPDPAKARKAFLVYDADASDKKGSYKLPFADIVDGKLVAISGGLQAAASRLPQTNIPSAVKDAARKVLDGYAKKKAMTTPDITKGIESVEQIFYAVGDAVDRLMRVASVTLQADALKLDPRPGPESVAGEIDAVVRVLTEVKAQISTTKALLSGATEAPAQEAASKATELDNAVDALRVVAASLHTPTAKAGAAMSAGRLKRFHNALKELLSVLREVGGDTKALTEGETEKGKGKKPAMKASAPAATPSAPAAAPEITDLAKRLSSVEAENDRLHREITVLKASPVPSQALVVEDGDPNPTAEDDFDWPMDMNQPLGRDDVPVEKSFHG